MKLIIHKDKNNKNIVTRNKCKKQILALKKTENNIKIKQLFVKRKEYKFRNLSSVQKHKHQLYLWEIYLSNLLRNQYNNYSLHVAR